MIGLLNLDMKSALIAKFHHDENELLHDIITMERIRGEIGWTATFVGYNN